MKKGQVLKIIRASSGAYATNNRYGEFVAMDGNKVVVKEGNMYSAFSRSCIQEVWPYSIGVQFLSNDKYMGRSPATTVYNYLVDEKEGISVGDLIWIKNTSGYAKVVAVDTRTEKATRRIDGVVFKKGQEIA